MAKTRVLVWGILAAVLLLTGAGAGWVAFNQDRLARALIERLEAHLLTAAHIDHIDVDLLSHFPNVSLVLHDAWLLGSHSPTDTLLKAHELSVACNALQLVGGNYELTALDVSNASLSVASNANGWNTQVWDADNGDVDNENFAIDQLALTNVQLLIDGQVIGVDQAALQLNWTESGLRATGAGQFAAVDAKVFATSEPLTWSGQVDWNAAEDSAHVSISSLQWLGVEASIEATRNAEWMVRGAVESVNVKALREAVALPSTYDALNSDATADGTFTWDGRTFKSNWALAPARWNVPFGDQTLQVQGDARLWVKHEGGEWRADAPHVALSMNGID